MALAPDAQRACRNRCVEATGRSRVRRQRITKLYPAAAEACASAATEFVGIALGPGITFVHFTFAKEHSMLSMIRRVSAAIAICCVASCRPGSVGPVPIAPDTAALRRDVSFLASDALEGRGTGTAGYDSASAYVISRWQDLGLTPVAIRDAVACEAGAGGSACDTTFEQRFVARSVALAHAGQDPELPTRNVVALLPGSDPELRDEYVVIGAHLDHLGRSSGNSLDPQAGTSIRNGADDNASGSAVVMELARVLEADPPRRSVLFLHFSGEELGLLGSQFFVENSPVPIENIVAMINFDMVGRLRADKLIVYGVSTAAEMQSILDGANAAPALDVHAVGDGFGPSDHSSFYAKGIPVLHLFTDLHGDYHRATDDVERINVQGMARVTSYAHRVARAIADRPTRLTAIRTAPRVASAPRSGSGAWFGSIPDMATSDTTGVRLTGVTPGSPADKAGVKAGDVIVEFGGKAVGDLYDYTDALQAYEPGDTVQVVLRRDGQPVTLTAILGRRGQR